jgi:CheY-like chemotaxis protein
MLRADSNGQEDLLSTHRAKHPQPDAILVVEDDEDTRDALCSLLRGENYRVLYAKNGREALQVLSRARPALIVMDLSMPVMTGWQLLDCIHDRKLLPGVPIIVLSADARPPSTDVCFLQKPVGAEHLLEEISHRLEHR